METIDSLDKECSALGGLFQQVVNDMKNGVPHYEDFVNKAAKLHSQLKNTIIVLGSFLDAFQKIADAATNTKGATREIGACLTRIVIRHKALEARMKTLCSALLDCMVLPMQDKMEEWKKSVTMLDKEHAKEYKKLRSEIKKKSEAAIRLQKKNKKNCSGRSNDSHQRALDSSNNDLVKHLKLLEDTEKSAVRRVLTEERARYCTFVSCLKPVLDEEISMMSEFQQLEEINKKLVKHTDDPFKLPPASEQVINDTKSGDGNFTFQTPPSSPSSLGSRKSSMCSISSAGSSNGSAHHSPSHHQSQIRHRSSSQQRNGNAEEPQHPVSAFGPMRLSSISSQDSGFTSQDTLFLRPGSPGRKLPVSGDPDLNHVGPGSSNASAGTGNVLTDRPHTISSAYEKGHQRPSLQPYTFNPPESTLTIQENDGEHVVVGQRVQAPPRPPIPQRSLSTSSDGRPSIPGKPLAAAMAAAKQQQLQQIQMQQQQLHSRTSLPNFNLSKDDMVVPQPVYMNMSELASLSAQKAAAIQHNNDYSPLAEDSPDLKTPTAEDISVPEQKVGDAGSSSSESSLGSSSGYGSQSTVRTDEQPHNHKQNHNQTPTHQPMQHNSSVAINDGYMPPPALLLDDSKYVSLPRSSHHRDSNRSSTLVHRPYSFTPGMLPDNVNHGGGLMGTPSHLAALRHGNYSKPAPPIRKNSSAVANHVDNSFPPPPPPVSGCGNDGDLNGSNSTTPRGSMENLPPPPPHLLHSDEDEPHQLRDASPKVLIAQRGRSVAEGVKALQIQGHTPCSPKTLRRAHSMAAAHTYQQTGSPQLRSNSIVVGPDPQVRQEIIYAPVAELQQKINQRHHAPPSLVQQQQLQQQQHQPTHHNGRSPEGEQYGFGVQFQQQQTQFYHSHIQEQHHQRIPATSVRYHQEPHPHQTYPSYSSHDSIMQEVDVQMRHRPQPPPLPSQQQQQQQVGHMQRSMSSYDAQTAMRVRRWIESRTTTNVVDCRPILNAEIQRGIALKKTNSVNDRSAPKI